MKFIQNRPILVKDLLFLSKPVKVPRQQWGMSLPFQGQVRSGEDGIVDSSSPAMTEQQQTSRTYPGARQDTLKTLCEQLTMLGHWFLCMCEYRNTSCLRWEFLSQQLQASEAPDTGTSKAFLESASGNQQTQHLRVALPHTTESVSRGCAVCSECSILTSMLRRCRVVYRYPSCP